MVVEAIIEEVGQIINEEVGVADSKAVVVGGIIAVLEEENSVVAAVEEGMVPSALHRIRVS